MVGSVGGRVAGGETYGHLAAAKSQAEQLSDLGDTGGALRRRELGAGLRSEVAVVGRMDAEASSAWLSNANKTVCFSACSPPSIEARNWVITSTSCLSFMAGTGGELIGRSSMLGGGTVASRSIGKIKRLFPSAPTFWNAAGRTTDLSVDLVGQRE